MSSSAKTPNLGLNNWSATDMPERADFVADNQKIDAMIVQTTGTDTNKVMSQKIITDNLKNINSHGFTVDSAIKPGSSYNINLIKTNGIYMVFNGTNAPSTGSYIYFVGIEDDSKQAGIQVAFGYYGSAKNKIYYRSFAESTFTAWILVL